MGLNIEIYKKSHKKEIGAYVCEFRNTHDFLDILIKIDNTNYFPEIGLGIFRIEESSINELNKWLIENRHLNWQYDCLLDVTEKNIPLFIYANF